MKISSQGVLKFFNAKKGYGFVTTTNQTGVYVGRELGEKHLALMNPGMTVNVTYEPGANGKGPIAISLEFPRYHGNLKWFDRKKGYGFIICEPVGRDVFLHHSGLAVRDVSELEEGSEFDFFLIEKEPGRLSADHAKMRVAA